MQSSTHRGDNSYISLGERRGKSDLARFSLDLSWARAVSDAAPSKAYPSPPMSGSPPLPPSRNPDASDCGHGSYGSTGQDPLRGAQATQPEHPERSRGPPGQGQAFQEPLPHAAMLPPYRVEEMPQQQLPYQQQQAQIPLQQQPRQHTYVLQGPPPGPAPDRPAVDARQYSSPKVQRKTKGHVASACVPCKRAHLRCDAQRPCSRCLSNGKEDTCVDVQHKKRGRPRLRDEREPRYEALGPNYPPPPDVSMRRPLSLYTEAPFPAFGESHQRSGPYRVLKSQSAMSGPITPRYLEHASPADANIYGPWAPPTLRMLAPQEPICAYLNMEMQIAKASQGFGETIGIQPVVSRKLHDIVAANDRDKVFRLQRLFEDERREREPNYLPPIYLKLEEDRVIQAVALGPDALAQFRTERQERVTFQGPDGQQRAFQVRFGLAKKESTYFIVLVLDIPATPQSYPHNLSAPYPREPYSRDSQYGFQPAQQQPYPNPSVPPFVANTPFGDPRGEMSTYRMTGPMGPNVPSSTNMTVPSPPQRRQDYSQGQNNPYQTPRSELPPSPESQRQRDLQLPPIREQRGEGYSADSMQRRDDRSNRFDIGGLLARSDHAGGGH
ncbi:hypothetical protein M430DRAFT_248263 [Amorphotheca resinae ATCC 22711]|uniref:Zn(2)-C6 fungal-type domain-containing protein n=1 Tax=Amorphotheca resinae ATCC 22711 TaxID=857342 RepID=A0A2T3B047_AMORE|nr:hypothetical protein M430DRAFT_248263 [Amorphotheca resinae ATCC 22711]PSS16780.1 hypothetical protein M430DRAFT_248263 [Amorphotheca resinae ATCC 22711]